MAMLNNQMVGRYSFWAILIVGIWGNIINIYSYFVPRKNNMFAYVCWVSAAVLHVLHVGHTLDWIVE